MPQRSQADGATTVQPGTQESTGLSDLPERSGEYTADLPAERLAALQAYFPTLDVTSPQLRLLNSDPPIFVMEGILDEHDCTAFVESMRGKDGQFPARLGQSNMPAVPNWMSALTVAMKGLPMVDWLGNPTVRWTYKSRNLLLELVEKVRNKIGLDLQQGAANIKHYRADQWLPVHIDYNKATMMTYLNDVSIGGHTIFPTLGFKVRPEKGSALVWPNQPPLQHAGDRVLDGEKWILFYNWPAVQNWEYDDNFDFND